MAARSTLVPVVEFETCVTLPTFEEDSWDSVLSSMRRAVTLVHDSADQNGIVYLAVTWHVPGGDDIIFPAVPAVVSIDRVDRVLCADVELPPRYAGDALLYAWWAFVQSVQLLSEQATVRFGEIDVASLSTSMDSAADVLGMPRYPASPFGAVDFPPVEMWRLITFVTEAARDGWLKNPAWVASAPAENIGMWEFSVSGAKEVKELRDVMMLAARDQDKQFIDALFRGSDLPHMDEEWVHVPTGLSPVEVREVSAALQRTVIPQGCLPKHQEAWQYLRQVLQAAAALGMHVGQCRYGGPQAGHARRRQRSFDAAVSITGFTPSEMAVRPRWIAGHDHDGRYAQKAARSLEDLGLCWAYSQHCRDNAVDLRGLWQGVHWVVTGSACFVPGSLESAAFFGFDGELTKTAGPVRLSVEQVQAVSQALSSMTIDEKWARFVPADMVAAGVEPAIWTHDNVWQWELAPLVERVTQFYWDAANDGSEVVFGLMTPPTTFEGWGNNAPF